MLDDEARRRAVEARKAKIAAGANLRRDWMDADYWDEAARARGIRLPAWWVIPTRNALNSWHRRLLSGHFSDTFGCKPDRLIDLNPRTPLRVFVGIMLEMTA